MSPNVRYCVESSLKSQVLLQVGEILFSVVNELLVDFHIFFHFLGLIVILIDRVYHLLEIVLSLHVSIVEAIHQSRCLSDVIFKLFQSTERITEKE